MSRGRERERYEIIPSSFTSHPVVIHYSSTSSEEAVESSSEYTGGHEEYEVEEEEYTGKWVPVWKALICEFMDSSPPGNYWLTKLLIVVNVIVSIVMFGKFIDPVGSAKYFPNVACILSNQCFDQLLISMFSHAGIIHLLGNMMFLYIVGDNIEITLGRLRYLIIYFVSGLVATYVQAIYSLLFMKNTLHVILIGASGAISGLIGAYVLLYPGSRMCYCISIGWIFRCFKISAVTMLIPLWLLLQFINLVLAPYIAVWAHVGGFLTGYVLAYVLADRGRIERVRQYFKRGVYRGFRIPIYELRKHSLPRWARGVIVFVSIIVSTLAFSAYPLLVSLNGKYHVVYYIGSECSLILGSPATFCRRIYSEIVDKPVDQKAFKEYVLIIRVTKLENLDYTGLAMITLSLLLVAGTTYVGFKGYREVEVTYIEKHDKHGENPSNESSTRR